jgi:hypothetical protein
VIDLACRLQHFPYSQQQQQQQEREQLAGCSTDQVSPAHQHNRHAHKKSHCDVKPLLLAAVFCLSATCSPVTGLFAADRRQDVELFCVWRCAMLVGCTHLHMGQSCCTRMCCCSLTAHKGCDDSR